MKRYHLYSFKYGNGYFFHSNYTDLSYSSSRNPKGAFDHVQSNRCRKPKDLPDWELLAGCDSFEDLEENYPELFI